MQQFAKSPQTAPSKHMTTSIQKGKGNRYMGTGITDWASISCLSLVALEKVGCLLEPLQSTSFLRKDHQTHNVNSVFSSTDAARPAELFQQL
eukprot:g30886.t1